MKTINSLTSSLVLLATATAAQSSSCPTTVSSTLPAPSVAPGYEARLVATGLTSPRGIVFDSQGHLLVVQKNAGLIALTLDDQGGSCVSVQSQKTVVGDASLNHGIFLSHDGTTLFASSPEAVYQWPYNPMTASNTSMATTVVANMTTDDHTTRTLVLSRQVNGTLIVTRGSTSNIDPEAEDISTGHSQIKAFNLLNRTGTYNFNNDGRLLGWGLRNDVGIAEHPTSGGIYSVENSVDQMERDGQDIHENNPAEEMNYLGKLTDAVQNPMDLNYGYPECYTAWLVSDIPNNAGLKTGMQFAIGTQNSTVNDTLCQQDRMAPRLAFEPHMAPLDIKFNSAGSEAWVSFHGSWDRTDPSGYKVSAIAFSNGEPVAPSTSMSGYIDIVANPDNSQCPDNCFRPVGLAFDSKGRLFFSSDASGEIYVVVRSGSDGSVDSSTPTASTPSVTSGSASAASTTADSPAPKNGESLILVLLAATAIAMLLL